MSETATQPLTTPFEYADSIVISVNVSNFDAAVEWYGKALGFEVIYRLDQYGWGELRTPLDAVQIGLGQSEELEQGGTVPTFRVKNIDAARWFLIDYTDDWEAQFTASKGYNNPFLKAHQKKPMPVLGTDTKLTHLQDIAGFVQPVGYPGPSSQAAYDALNNHHVTDMFANFITGKKSIDDTIADAKKRLQDSLTKFPV